MVKLTEDGSGIYTETHDEIKQKLINEINLKFNTSYTLEDIKGLDIAFLIEVMAGALVNNQTEEAYFINLIIGIIKQLTGSIDSPPLSLNGIVNILRKNNLEAKIQNGQGFAYICIDDKNETKLTTEQIASLLQKYLVVGTLLKQDLSAPAGTFKSLVINDGNEETIHYYATPIINSNFKVKYKLFFLQNPANPGSVVAEGDIKEIIINGFKEKYSFYKKIDFTEYLDKNKVAFLNYFEIEVAYNGINYEIGNAGAKWKIWDLIELTEAQIEIVSTIQSNK